MEGRGGVVGREGRRKARRKRGVNCRRAREVFGKEITIKSSRPVIGNNVIIIKAGVPIPLEELQLAAISPQSPSVMWIPNVFPANVMEQKPDTTVGWGERCQKMKNSETPRRALKQPGRKLSP